MGQQVDPAAVLGPKLTRAGTPRKLMASVSSHLKMRLRKNNSLAENKLVPYHRNNHLIANVLVVRGDTIPTGIPFKVSGKKVPCLLPLPTPARPLRMKDDASYDIQYLDVEQGLNSSYVFSLLEDSRGYLWFGTYGGGVSCYDGKSFIHLTEIEGLSLPWWSALQLI